jgi:3-hydroxyacyl-[acyl-carrier-protein] dehydratase
MVCDLSMTFWADEEIEQLIPHRGSAQMIDRIMHDEITPQCVFGYKKIHSDDPYVQGHFPDNPIFPGYCQLECACLVAAILIRTIFPDIQGTPLFAGADGLRWKEIVRPGDFLTIIVEFVEQKKGLFFCSATIKNQHGKTTAKIKEIIGTVK